MTTTQSPSTTVLDCMSVFKGHTNVITINDDDPTERPKLAEHVSKMLKDGFSIVVKTADGESHNVSGYDATTNEWIVKPKNKTAKPSTLKRVAAAASKAMGIAPRAGG